MVSCPAGQVAVTGGGSFGAGDGTGVGGAFLQTSRPNPATGTPTGWFVIFDNASTSSYNVRIYVVCASA